MTTEKTCHLTELSNEQLMDLFFLVDDKAKEIQASGFARYVRTDFARIKVIIKNELSERGYLED